MENLNSKFFRAFIYVLKFEGQYANDPNDPGGETKYGISKKVFDKLEIKDLTLDDAMKIYHNYYWDAELAMLSNQKLINKILAARVNLGKKKASKIFQFTLAKYFDAPLIIDGIIGKRTVLAANRIMQSAEETKYLIKVFSYELARYYESIGTWRYMKGWLKRALD